MGADPRHHPVANSLTPYLPVLVLVPVGLASRGRIRQPRTAATTEKLRERWGRRDGTASGTSGQHGRTHFESAASASSAIPAQGRIDCRDITRSLIFIHNIVNKASTRPPKYRIRKAAKILHRQDRQHTEDVAWSRKRYRHRQYRTANAALPTAAAAPPELSKSNSCRSLIVNIAPGRAAARVEAPYGSWRAPP